MSNTGQLPDDSAICTNCALSSFGFFSGNTGDSAPPTATPDERIAVRRDMTESQYRTATIALFAFFPCAA